MSSFNSLSFEQTLKDFELSELQLLANLLKSQQIPAVINKAANQQRLTLEDFALLISPAANQYLESMAHVARKLTQQRFGKTIQLYIPLYLSNQCSNICSYCGFSMHNNIRRTTLDLGQIEAECQAIKAMGFDHILLVTGESEKRVGMSYFQQVLPLVKRYFSHVSMEVQPLETEQYQQLKQLGLDAVLVYQETYNQISYQQHHIKGKKSDFSYRLATPERLGKAGIDKIGLGVLLGLDHWQQDALYLAKHLRFLQQHYWQSRYSLSFPRLRPCAGGFEAKHYLTDSQLVQLILAFRLFDSSIELSLSTREPQYLRDNLIGLGITSMSAASSTQPGGYSAATKSALEQFSIDDNRSAQTIAKVIEQQGYQAVWKDWQLGFGVSE